MMRARRLTGTASPIFLSLLGALGLSLGTGPWSVARAQPTGETSKTTRKGASKPAGALSSSASSSTSGASPDAADAAGSGPAPAATSVSASAVAAPLGTALPGRELSLVPAEGGASVSFGELLGAKERVATVTVFMSSRCPYVAEARQPLGELAKTWAGKVAFVGVVSNQNETSDELRADAAAHDAFPLWRDEKSRLADALGARHTPEVFVTDGAGVLRYHGGVSELGAALTALGAKKPVLKAEVAAFGCTIKRRK